MRHHRTLVSVLGLFLLLASGAVAAQPVTAHSLEEGYAFVEVPIYAQQRNLSCEYASLVIAMGAYGTWVSE